MATFVLVHGAWHGAWCWQRVRRELAALGHEVFAPTLSGLCERSHLLSRDVDLQTHIDDVVNMIRWRELSDVVLCGHSYGGCVISGVAGVVPDRIAAKVYLDAFLPAPGQSLYDILPPEARQAQLDLAAEHGDGWRVPPIPAEIFNVNAADRAWVDAQCTPQPLATFRQALPAPTGGLCAASNHYIYASDWEGTPFSAFYEEAKALGWTTSEVACGHDVMLDRPGDLVRELVALAPAP